MKKLIFAIFFFVGLCAFAQDDQPVFKRNELKLNVGAVACGFPEINYERIIAKDMGVGIAGMFSLIEEATLEYQILPFYRMYFGRRKPASGLYVEVNAALVGQRNEEYTSYYDDNGYYLYSDSKPVRAVSGGVGVAVGIKWLNSRGFTGDAYAGLGRLYGEPIMEIYPRVGISLGKRF